MEKIRLEDMDVIAGVEWTALPTEMPEKKALAEYLSKSKAKRGIVMRHKGVTVVGRADFKTKSTPSALALLALASQRSMEESGASTSDASSDEHNWILIEQVSGSEEKFWMGAVKNGVPLPGGDIVGSRATVIEEVLNIITNNINFTVFTVDKEVRYNVLGQVNVVDKKFVDVVRGVPPKKAELARFSITMILVVTILLLAVVLGGGWYAYTIWDEKQRAEQQRLAQAQQARDAAAAQAIAEQQYEADVRKGLLEGLEAGMAEIKKSLETSGPTETINAWRELLYSVDAYQHTWTLDKIECVVEETTPKCNLLLKRNQQGIDRLLLEARPDAVIEGDAASYTISGTSLQLRPIDLKIITSTVDFQKGILSDLQYLRPLGISHQVGASRDVVKQVTLPAQSGVMAAVSENTPVGGTPPPQAVSIQLGFASGSVTLKGEQLWELSGVSRYLDSPNVSIKSLSLIVPPQMDKNTWDLTVEYLVRTLPQPIIPPVPMGDKTINVPVPAEYRSVVDVQEGGISESSITATSLPDDTSTSEPSNEQAEPSF